jgi:hypothetical protein
VHRSTHTLGAVAFLATILLVVLLLIALLDPELARALLGDGSR